MSVFSVKARLRRAAGAAGWAAVLLLPGVAACGGGGVPLPDVSPSAVGDTAGLVERGEYLVRNVSACGHCHAADPRRDPDGPLRGGLAFRNWRLGTIRASNLTPDSATGLGAWTDAEIVRAIRSGQSRRGRTLAPAMPYEWLNGLSDRDALAIARYLKSQPPVRNEVKNRPSLALGIARIFFIGPVKVREHRAPPRAPTPEYGRYLADHAALCADCHTPRSGLFAEPDRRKLYAGDATPPKGFPANPSNITPDTATGIGKWSEADFVRALRTGVTPQGDTLHPFMPWREYRRMTDGDLQAIYRYLRTVKPIRNPVPRRAPERPEG